jgi:hypothetical protein
MYSFSQTTSEIFKYKAMTFYGLDFTGAKCIGKTDFPSGGEMVNVYFQDWNDMFMTGKDKLKIGKPYKKKKIEYDTLVFEYNKRIDSTNLIIDGSYSFKKSDIEDYTLKFADSEKAGIGMVYLVESLNRESKYISIWITFFKNSTGEVLLTEPVRAKGKGRKFDDFWRAALYKLYTESAYDYKTWSSIYK